MAAYIIITLFAKEIWHEMVLAAFWGMKTMVQQIDGLLESFNVPHQSCHAGAFLNSLAFA